MNLCSHHMVVMHVDVEHRVETKHHKLCQEAKHEDEPSEALVVLHTNNKVSINIKVVIRDKVFITEINMEVVEVVIEGDHGGYQVEEGGPMTTEIIEETTKDHIPMLTVVRFLLLLVVSLWMMQEQTTLTTTGMTGGKTMTLTSRSTIKTGTYRMSLHQTSRSESHTPGTMITAVSANNRTNKVLRHKRGRELTPNLKGKNIKSFGKYFYNEYSPPETVLMKPRPPMATTTS